MRLAPAYVPHLGLEEVRRLMDAAERTTNRTDLKERNRLLIAFLFDSCLRISEALRVRPCDMELARGGWVVHVMSSKSRLWEAVAISASLAAQLQAYCYRQSIPPGKQIFPIIRPRVHQIIAIAMKEAGISKPEGVGTVHVLRHSGALERLRRTGNPKALQDQLRHRSAEMTLRYMKTLSREESIAIQQEVDLQW